VAIGFHFAVALALPFNIDAFAARFGGGILVVLPNEKWLGRVLPYPCPPIFKIAIIRNQRKIKKKCLVLEALFDTPVDT